MSAATPPFDALTGWRYPRTQPSLPESHGSVTVPQRGAAWRKALAFAGPGYMVAVGYMERRGGDRDTQRLVAHRQFSEWMA